VTVRINTALRNAMADQVGATIDGGSGAGRLRIYTGSQPATPATSPSGTLLCEITLNDPSMEAAASGVAALDVSPALSGTGVAAGTAGWARFLTSTEAAGTGLGVVDGSVTATGGGGDVTVATTTVSIGLTVSVTSASFTAPAS
jgi:hypothetical protein